MSDNIQITEAAKNQIAKLSKQNNNQFVRLAIISGGCNGFSKNWSFDFTKQPDDLEIDCGDAVLLIDSISLSMLQNSTIDYKTELMGSFFNVDIPEATSSCGCGTSFSI